MLSWLFGTLAGQPLYVFSAGTFRRRPPCELLRDMQTNARAAINNNPKYSSCGCDDV